MNNEQKVATDRLIERCAGLIEENKTLTQRRKEALRSHLEERTKAFLLKESLLLAAELLGERLGSCPGDILEWSYLNDCDFQCGQDKGVKEQIDACWYCYLKELGERAYKEKMDGGTFSILSANGKSTPDNKLELLIVDDPGGE